MPGSAGKRFAGPRFSTVKAGSLTAIAAAIAGMLHASSATAAGDVVVGVSATLSGPIAQLGETGLRGIQSAVEAINSQGGLLGKTIRVVTADDGMSPATGTTNVRRMILSDHVVALFGPVTSAVGAAEVIDLSKSRAISPEATSASPSRAIAWRYWRSCGAARS